MLLTVVAYSLVIADCIPTLGYLTFMDKCNLAGYVMISLVILQLSFVEYSYPSSEAKRAILPCHAPSTRASCASSLRSILGTGVLLGLGFPTLRIYVQKLMIS